MTAASAWVLAGALWLGCLQPGHWLLAPLGALGVLGSLAAGTDRRRLLAAVAAVGVLGSGLAGARVSLADAATLAERARTGGAVAVVGTVATEVRATEHGAWTILRVTAVDGRPVRERTALRLSSDLGEAPALGDRVAVRVTARPLAQEGFDAHLRRLHAVAELTPVSALAVTARAGPLWRSTSWVRARARAVAGDRLDADRASVLTGVLIGDVTGQDPERRAQLAGAGLTHLVVVSGRHVGLLLAGVLGGAALLGAGARGRRVTGLVALGWYVVLVRWQPSVLRAGTMAGLVLGAGLLGRRADARHSLAMAVLLLLLVDPLLAGHLGFCLSVAATAGVLVVTPWATPRIRGPRPVAMLVAASFGAQLGAAPLLLTLDHGLPLASLPANLVAVPLAAAAQAIGLLAVGVGVVAPQAGGVVAACAGPFLAGILWVAALAADGPRVEPGVFATPLAGVLALAVLVRRRAPRVALAALVGVVVLATVPMVRPPPMVTALTVTALDVGQGDALLVEVPGRAGAAARMLVDGGPDARSALSALRARGVRALDAVLVSHPHHDHTGGLPAVLAALPVGVLLVGPEALDPFAAAPSAAETERIAAQRGVPLQRLVAGQRFDLGVAAVEILSPPADGSLAFDLNEGSVVARVATADGSLLLTGDAEVAAQTLLLDRPERLRSTILKVPHHGGSTNTNGFLAAVGATDALIGVGGDNTYGHPTPAVLDELRGVRVHRTDEDGTVTLTVTAEGVQRRRRGRTPPLHSRPCRDRRCTYSPDPRSCCSTGPRRASSSSSRPRARSRSSTCAPPSSGKPACRTCGQARCSARAAS